MTKAKVDITARSIRANAMTIFAIFFSKKSPNQIEKLEKTRKQFESIV